MRRQLNSPIDICNNYMIAFQICKNDNHRFTKTGMYSANSADRTSLPTSKLFHFDWHK